MTASPGLLALQAALQVNNLSIAQRTALLTVLGECLPLFEQPGNNSGTVDDEVMAEIWTSVLYALDAEGAPVTSPLATPAWFVDPANATGHASDLNAGTSGTTPLLTFAELFRRIGTVPQWDADVVGAQVAVTQMSDQALNTDSYLLTPRMLNGVNVVWQAQNPQRGTAFSPASVTAAVKSSAGTRLKLNGNLPAGTAAGDVVINVTKASQAMISAVAAGSATCTQPVQTASLAFPGLGGLFGFPVEDNTWAAGDTYEIFRPLLSNMQLITQDGGTIAASGNDGALFIRGFFFNDTSSGSTQLSLVAEGGSMWMISCASDLVIAANITNGDVGGLQSCFVSAPVFLQGGALFAACETSSSCELNGQFNNIGVGSVCARVGIAGTDNFVGDCGTTVSFLVSLGGVVDLSSAHVWGPCIVNVSKGGNLSCETTFGAALTVATLQLDGLLSGSSYAAGVWTDGIALTSANLDAHNGLQNPRTGSRYSNGV